MFQAPCLRHRVHSAIVFAMLALMLSACSGSISGQVFVDADGDGIHDSDEVGVPYAELSVTRDGKEVARHYSDQGGYFDIPIKRRPGEVCVTTDLTYSEAHIAAIQESIHASAKQKSAGNAKAQVTTDDQDNDGIYDNLDNCPSVANANQMDTDGDGIGDVCEESEDDEPSVTAETPDTATETQGWQGAKYCEETKNKAGFEVDIPVSMSHEAALSALPEREAAKCYAGNTCDVVIIFPDGCKLNTLYLPQGLSPASSMQAGMSFDDALGSVDFDRNAGVEGGESSKAKTTTQTTLSVSTYRILTLKLAAAENIAIGTTNISLKPTAECPGQSLELPDIAIELIRDFQAQPYWHIDTLGELVSGQEITLDVGIENQGPSTISFGDVTVIPPEGSILTDIPEDCFNNVTRVICHIEHIPGESTVTKAIILKLPTLDPALPSGETEEYDLELSFFAPGMDQSVERSGKIVIKQP